MNRYSLTALALLVAPPSVGAEKAPGENVYVIGNSGWRVSIPPGYAENARGTGGSMQGLLRDPSEIKLDLSGQTPTLTHASWSRPWREIRLSQPPIEHRLTIAIVFPMLMKIGACEQGSKLSGSVIEGDHHGVKSYSYRCHSLRIPNQEAEDSDHYVLAVGQNAAIHLNFTSNNHDFPKMRAALLPAFRAMQRTLAPDKPGVNKPAAAPAPVPAPGPKPAAAPPSEPSVVPLLR